MKKSVKILIAVIAVLVVIAIVATVIVFNMKKDQNQSSNSKLTIASTEDMKGLIDQMYQGLETFPSVMTNVVDIADQNAVTNATGLISTDKIDAVVVSEPMISSQAYSAVLVKVKDAKDADSIAKEMNEKVDARKWICVAAEKIYSTSSGNIVCLVMSSEEMAKPVYDKFKELAGGIGQEYSRTFDQGFIDDNLGGEPIEAL